MPHYVDRKGKLRHRELRPDEVLAIAKRDGSFSVTPRWRDDGKRKIISDLVRLELLEPSPRFDRWKNISYVLTDKGRELEQKLSDAFAAMRKLQA